jgi:hypothetical protein
MNTTLASRRYVIACPSVTWAITWRHAYHHGSTPTRCADSDGGNDSAIASILPSRTPLFICAHVHQSSVGSRLRGRPRPERNESSNDLVHARRPEISSVKRVGHIRIQHENLVRHEQSAATPGGHDPASGIALQPPCSDLSNDQNGSSDRAEMIGWKRRDVLDERDSEWQIFALARKLSYRFRQLGEHEIAAFQVSLSCHPIEP